MDKYNKPTVLPAVDFDAAGDANALRSAMKGCGTDEAEIIEILCKRSNAQRQLIAEAYKESFDRDLTEDLKSELGGNFEDVVVGLMMPTDQYCAKQLHDAMKGAGTTEDRLIEFILSRPSHEIRKIASAYEILYGASLEDDVRDDTSGLFQELLIKAIQGARMEDVYDPAQAQESARKLFDAGERRLGTDESTFIEILALAGQRQANLIFDEYKIVSGNTIEHALKEEMSGELLRALLATVGSIRNRPAYFAERLHEALKGAATDDNALIRIIVSRCEIDLASIKIEYERSYSESLYNDVKGDTSGDYRRALLALIGKF